MKLIRLSVMMLFAMIAPVIAAQDIVLREVTDSIRVLSDGGVEVLSSDTIPERPSHLVREAVALDSVGSVADSGVSAEGLRMRSFNPDPTRAVWLSALCPGLGQIYNRRYWKLPIVVGAYMGLAYATSWNNDMLTDYTRAYRDLMDNDPDTKSYMNFFAPGVQESDLSRTWLENVFKSRKNYYRRNRDLCIIAMVGVYLVAMVDAYVDASLAHFDITPELSLDWSPAVIPDSRGKLPGVGLQWAFTF